MESIDHKLLLAEYNHFSESLWRNEEIGEKRVSYFVSLVTAVLSGLVAIDVADLGGDIHLPSLILAFLAILLVVGILTFMRMLRRNRVTDEYIDIIKYVREQMRLLADDLDTYELNFRKPRTLLRGGLAEMVAALNALIISALIYFLLQNTAIGSELTQEEKRTWVVWCGFMACFVQALPIMQRRWEKSTWPVPSPFFRAGVGILILNGDRKLLAFERKGYKDSWQFPQGGIDGDESPLRAVYRELKEETGLTEQHVSTPFTPELMAYELPEAYRNAKTGRGQTQYWFLFQFTGTDQDISLGDGKEFTDWDWMGLEDVINKTVDFRKPLYRQLGERFRTHLP